MKSVSVQLSPEKNDELKTTNLLVRLAGIREITILAVIVLFVIVLGS